MKQLRPVGTRRGMAMGSTRSASTKSKMHGGGGGRTRGVSGQPPPPPAQTDGVRGTSSEGVEFCCSAGCSQCTGSGSYAASDPANGIYCNSKMMLHEPKCGDTASPNCGIDLGSGIGVCHTPEDTACILTPHPSPPLPPRRRPLPRRRRPPLPPPPPPSPPPPSASSVAAAAAVRTARRQDVRPIVQGQRRCEGGVPHQLLRPQRRHVLLLRVL